MTASLTPTRVLHVFSGDTRLRGFRQSQLNTVCSGYRNSFAGTVGRTPEMELGRGVSCALENLEHEREKRHRRLRTFEPFVLDNSIRETNVATVMGHVLEDKIRILREVEEVGFR